MGALELTYSYLRMAAVGHGYNELERRRVIKTLLDAGDESTRELSERSGLCKATVTINRVRNRLQAGGTIRRKFGSGSIQHLSGVAIDKMHDIVQPTLKNGGSASTAKIHDHIEEETGEVVSRRTVRRALHREGQAAKKRRPGPALMEHHKEARQVWRVLHRDNAFDATVFIDKANFHLHRKRQVVWCLANKVSPRMMPHTSPSLTVYVGDTWHTTYSDVQVHAIKLNARTHLSLSFFPSIKDPKLLNKITLPKSLV